MPTGEDGKFYRSHGQAARMGKKAATTEAAHDMTHTEDAAVGKGSKNIVAIKHNGGPPYQVKHEDGQVTSHDSHEDLMSHLAEHIPGGEGMEDESHESMENDGMDSDYGSEGSKAAIESLLG